MKNVAIIKFDKILNKTLVYTSDKKEYSFEEKPLILINKWCIMNGSTIEGRIQAFNSLMENKRKSPIYVCKDLLLFTTCAKDKDECIFINYHTLLRFQSMDDHQTNLLFMEGYQDNIMFNYRIISKQVSRCKEYLDILYRNKKLLSEGL